MYTHLGLVSPASGRCRVQPLATRPCVCIGRGRVLQGSDFRIRSPKVEPTRGFKGGFGLAFGNIGLPLAGFWGAIWPQRRHRKSNKNRSNKGVKKVNVLKLLNTELRNNENSYHNNANAKVILVVILTIRRKNDKT